MDSVVPKADDPDSETLVAELRARLREAEDTLDAIRNGDIDAVLVGQAGAGTIFTVENADRPYRFLIEQMKEGAMTLSETGVVLYGNRRLAEIFSMPLEKIVGSNLKRFFSASHAERLDSIMMLDTTDATRSAFDIERPDGTTTPISMSINELLSDRGEPRLLGAVITDMTQQHVLEARLRQAQKMEAVGQLTGGLAHDFNNLLQAIYGNLSLIKLRPADPRVAQWAVNGLKSAASGAKLTAQLLAFSRDQDIQLRPVHVSTVIQDMTELLKMTLGSAITIDYALGDDTVCILADRTQLEMAVLNLAINARDAMKTGGVLTIGTALRQIDNDPDLLSDAYLEISVSDNGVGMSDEVRTRAFDPFFTTKTVGQGTGLGLAQVYGITRQAGGVARIMSRVDEGTRVTLLFRISSVVAQSAVTGAVLPSIPKNRIKPRILLIDDDDHVRDAMVLSLELLGYDVAQAANGAIGLQRMASAPPDVLVIDFAMPGMNGAEVVKHARHMGYNMPVIFASGYADTAAINNAVGFNANILSKPFAIEALATELEKALLSVRTALPIAS